MSDYRERSELLSSRGSEDSSSGRTTPSDYRSKRYNGSVVLFSNLSYEVEISKGCCKGERKTVLRNVSGVFKPGTMNAIMGPTGSGKSTLLDILAVRKHPSGLTGQVLIDGKPQPADFRLMSGYVVQDDIVMSTLTVRENLQFSADLRLPRDSNQTERAARVQTVIDQLSLGNCADTRIGNQFIRGVSGGERKRCNIGMELIPAPGILFLDEPTTGLDASTAHSVMMLLKRLAHAGSTIIFSIHQPRYSIYKLCDTILLLGNGQTIYQGPALEGIQFFHSIGYEIEEHDNPADFYLDVLIGESKSKNDDVPMLSPSGSGDETALCLEEGDPVERTNRQCAELAAAYQRSPWHQRIIDEINPNLELLQGSVAFHQAPGDVTALSYHTGAFTQFGVLCRRTFLNLMRNPRTGLMQWVITLVFGGITGAFYFQVKDNCNPGIQDRVGAFFFVVMNQIFANLSAIDLFILERGLFMHENVSGYYRTSAYFFAKLFCDLLPYRTFPVIIYGTIVYWMMGLVPEWQMFFTFLLTIVMTSWSATFMAFAASASTQQQAIASLIVALIYVFQMVFSGLLINLKNITAVLRWLKYLSIFNYSMVALEINEFKNLNVSNYYIGNQTNPKTHERFNCLYGNDDAFLEQQGIAYEKPVDLWINIIALAGIALLFMIIAYIQLRRIQKLK